MEIPLLKQTDGNKTEKVLSRNNSNVSMDDNKDDRVDCPFCNGKFKNQNFLGKVANKISIMMICGHAYFQLKFLSLYY